MNIFDKTIQEVTNNYNKSLEKIVSKKLILLEEMSKNNEPHLYNILNNLNLDKSHHNILYIKAQIEKADYKFELHLPEMQVESIKSEDSYIIKTNIDEDKIKLSVSKLLFKI